MKIFCFRGLALLLLCVLSIPVTADAASYSRERSSRRGISSSTQKKIRNLDDDKVRNFPIPILFGVKPSNLTPNFGDPRDGGARKHEGEDILAPEGTPIVSPTEAVVLHTGTQSSAGKYVYTANPGGETFVYMHLSRIADIDPGDELKPGDIIGYVGDTGNAKGGVPHLHFEVQDDGDPTDPYPRLTGAFTLKEKISFLEDIFKDVKDDDEFAEFLVANFSSELLLAQSQKMELPEEIADIFSRSGSGTASAFPLIDLSIGASGSEVVWLQQKLIAADIGFAAKALASAGATGYFGPVTKAALIEYQIAARISPASGNFGPLTRAYMVSH